MKLLTITILAAISALALPGVAAAQDDAPTCSEGYELVISAGGPLCVGAVYLDGTWNDDPHDCVWGFYQGSCAPEPRPPVDLGEAAYTYQMDVPVITAPPVAVEDIAELVGWLTPVELGLADRRDAR